MEAGAQRIDTVRKETEMSTREPVYPLSCPAADDPRFTFGFVIEVAKAITKAGYPPFESGLDLVRLQQALFQMIYAREDVSNVA